MKISSFVIPFLWGNKLKTLKSSGRDNIKPHVDLVFIPGTGISPISYENVLENIQIESELKNISVDIHPVHLTGNVLHRFEIDRVVKSINKEIPEIDRNLVIMGHSGGGAIGIDIAKKTNASALVSWCSSFNSMGDLPWDSKDSFDFNIPSLTLLADQDRHVPFPIAIREFCEETNPKRNIFSDVLIDSGHFTGINDGDIYQVSSKTSEFLSSIFGQGKRSDMSEKFIYDNTLNTVRDFKSLAVQSNLDVSTIMMHLTDVPNTHYSVPPDMLLTLLYISVPILRPYIHNLVLFPMFLGSFPSKKASYTYSPMFDYFPTSLLNSPPLWAKVEIDKGKNRAAEMNKKIFDIALMAVTPEQRDRYEKYGRKIRFEDDFSIFKVPGCGLIWMMTPLLMRIDRKKNELVVKSPTIDIGNRMNAKLVSKRSCIEWILLRSFEDYSTLVPY